MERLDESTWFEIFRAGTWHGIEYKKEDLDKVIENFEKGDPKAPLIIGHNGGGFFGGGEEKPAHGWVKELKRSGNRLLAKARNVSAELVTAVNEEVYPMRSVELWMDYRGRGLALGAIAFLGGSNPEVGGMADFKFSRGADGDVDYKIESADGARVCFAYGSTEKMLAASGGQSSKKTNHQGGEDMTKEEIQAMIDAGVKAGVEQFKSSPEIVNLQAENQQLKSQVTEAQNHAAAVAVQADTEACLNFAKALLDAKKIVPAVFNAGLGGFLASLDNRDELEFSAGKKQTRRAFAMELLSSAPAKSALFSGVDNDPARVGEDENVSADVAAFAKKHALDPKIVQANFAAAKQGAVATVGDGDDDAGKGSGVAVSLLK